MNTYIDTRGLSGEAVPFTQAVINGLAHGGGLYVPAELPQLALDDIIALGEMPYAKRAACIFRAFGVDLPDEEIDRVVNSSYGSNFDSPDICPITSLDENTHILELWHGPTAAFKDMALQCLPYSFQASAQQLRDQGKLGHEFLILVATSGDTGKATLEGFADVDGISVGVLYPHGGVSDIQYKQMATQHGANVQVWAVEGNFDDCQTGVKHVFADEAFAKQLLEQHGIALSSANSINWGRLLPQVVYYVSSYAQLVHDGKLAAGELLDVCVPTGNFGNILAAWYAKRIGTPIATLFCASNANRVLTDFINTGTYDISSREFMLTPSPSMDILVSSNLERQLFELTDRNAQAIRQWMSDLNTKRAFSVDEQTATRFKETFAADAVDNETCLATIREVYERYDYVMDPHTAVAFRVAENLRSERPVLIASTAHWAKFGENVYRALTGLRAKDDLPANIAALTGCELNNRIVQDFGASAVPSGLADLDTLPIRFTEVIKPNDDAIREAALTFLDQMSAQ